MADYNVAFLSIMAPAVREEISGVAPANLKVRFADSIERDAQMALMPDADFIIGGATPITAEMIEAAPRLRLIQKWGIGYDKIDLEAARRQGVPVAITSGANAGPVAELAIALMLGVYRRIAFVDRKLRQGQWVRAEMRTVCYQIAGKTVGVYGFGNIGRTLAHRLRGFDAEVLYYDIRRAEAVMERALGARFVPFEELLGRSDILSVHVPLTDLTRASIGAKEIARMKSGAIIVNTARGGIVDETALYQALVAGKLRGAGLDVFAAEPADPAHPLLTLDQVVASPHIGGGVFDNVAHVARRAFGNIQQVLEGNPIPAADLIVPPRAAPAA